MSGVVIGVKPDQITMQDSQQKLIANRQNAIDLATRERRMEKEADFDVGPGITNLLAQHLRKQHEMIVMDPD